MSIPVAARVNSIKWRHGQNGPPRRVGAQLDRAVTLYASQNKGCLVCLLVFLKGVLYSLLLVQGKLSKAGK